MRKRVGLARALAMEPEVVLYDEPTTGLDPIMSDVINELILNTRRQHPVAGIVVTHDMRTAQKVADRVVMLYPLARLERRGATGSLRWSHLRTLKTPPTLVSRSSFAARREIDSWN
jgi:ABC-type transporter Mla maintaining outer membrane lipid asymmetry ATPase subunit MlaF